MYEYAGEWQYTVGVPAKSGVSGVLMVVVPNVGGFCLYQPKLDELGNSTVGVSFFKQLVRIFNFHIYDQLVGAPVQLRCLGGVRGPPVSLGHLVVMVSGPGPLPIRFQAAVCLCASHPPHPARLPVTSTTPKFFGRGSPSPQLLHRVSILFSSRVVLPVVPDSDLTTCRAFAHPCEDVYFCCGRCLQQPLPNSPRPSSLPPFRHQKRVGGEGG